MYGTLQADRPGGASVHARPSASAMMHYGLLQSKKATEEGVAGILACRSER
jgi:hypothetical protein